MQIRPYGNSGAQVSALGFGCMRLPMTDGHVEMDVAVEMIRRAIDLGVNYLDSAYGYCNGESEVAVGQAIKDGYRDRVYISTKNNVRTLDRAKWRQVLETQLGRLEVDRIDFYHFHGLSWKVWEEVVDVRGGLLEEMHRAQDEGLVHHCCFSCHDKPENMIRLIDTGAFDGMLVQYNLLDRANEEAIAHAHEAGMGVAIMGPVGGGRLVPDTEELRKLLPADAQRTPEAALRFVLSNPNVSIALSGMNTIEQVEENVATASREEPLSASERERVLSILEDYKHLADLYCTGCNYCMPCPNDIDIPGNFRIMNYHRLYGLTDYARQQYRRLGKKKVRGEVVEAWAEACKECGECEPKCPQEIPIIKQLAETAEVLGGE